MSFTSNMGNHEHPQHASSYASTHVSHGGQAQGQVPKEPQARKHRKLNRSAPQLKRNAACLPCRRRRIKCDAAKPACGSCVRSFQFLARTNPDAERDRAGVQCYYEEDEDEEESGGRGADDRVREGSGDPHATVRRLEAKVEELQRALSEVPTVYNQTPVHPPASTWTDQLPHPHSQSSSYPLRPQAMPSSSTHSSHSTSTPELPHSTVRSAFISELAPGGLQNERPTPPKSSSTGGPVMMQDLQGGLTDIAQNQSQVEGIDGEAGKVGGPFMDLIWPGWPPRLPTPAMMDHLIQVFFNMVPSISRLIHRQTFQSRLLLKPTHPNFPHTALLHAICAVSARYSAAVRTCSVESVIERADAKLWEEKIPAPGGLTLEESIGMEECFAERNMRYAQLECRMEDVNGRKLVDLVQAMALICYYCQQHANWIGGWMTIAQTVRAAIPLGLMRNTPGLAIGKIVKPGASLLPPPSGDWDREERRTLMFTILMFDINASSSSGWPNMMMVDELYSRLPCSRTDFEKGGEMQENPQTARSHDLFTHHPVEDSFIALIKGGILLNRVNKFIRYVKAAEPEEKAYLHSSPEFIQLDDDIRAFVQYFPASLRDPMKPLTGMHKGIDADLIAAHLLPHVAAIFLHEPFANVKDPACTSAVRLSTESRACLNTIHLVTSTSLDLSYTLVPITSCKLIGPVRYGARADLVVYCFTAARILLLFYQRSLELQDFASAKVLLSELEILKLAFKALGNRFAMGCRHWGMLQMMMDRIHKENGFVGPVDSFDQAIIPEPNMRARAFPTQQPDTVYTTVASQSTEPIIEVMDHRRGYVGKSASLNSDSTGRPSPGSLSDILGSQTPGSGHGHYGTGASGVYTASPLQSHAMPPPPPPPVATANDVFPPVINPSGPLPHPAIPIISHGHPSSPGGQAFDSTAFNQTNFNFSAGQNGWNGLSNAPGLTDISPPVPRVPVYDTRVPPQVSPHSQGLGQGGIGGGGYTYDQSLGGLSGFPTNDAQAGEVGFDWLNWLSTANVSMASEEGMRSM